MIWKIKFPIFSAASSVSEVIPSCRLDEKILFSGGLLFHYHARKIETDHPVRHINNLADPQIAAH